ncbi:hypothetical protein [Paenibacillus sedimenti]|uniref:Uncharacterized protein n=1 Tax=Paenibacillus sedimenti TaxID=2770274 RepID=A0A926KUR5_9BACL|nr:hypothetical protein [Paenibacillus sedimenti]MBD0382598.1 hypothetical protein [Paenibacillus sedimenti]
MSYDIHITKADHWVDSEKNPITEEELERVSDLFHTYKGIPFFYQQGRITVCGADERVIGLLIDIANRLDARVQGDEGEYYCNDENKYPQPPECLKQDFGVSEINIPDEQQRFIESIGVNDEIQHPKYGVGQIIEVLGAGADKEFVVKFSDGERVKRLLAYYAAIQPVR